MLCGRQKDAVAIGAPAVSPAEDAIAVLPQDPEVAIPTSIELNRRIHLAASAIKPVTAVGLRRRWPGQTELEQE